MALSSLTGRLLVASPRIGDGNFERTVVLLLAHHDDGAFGVVINRPSQTPVRELVPTWADQVSEPSMMFLGGPVAKGAVVGVGVLAGSAAGDVDVAEAVGFQSTLGTIGTVDLNADPDELAPLLGGLRLFAGSAGWSGGQLESELAEQAWWVVDADPADVTSDDPEGLWRLVLRRQPGPTAWYAVFPPDPMVN